MKIKIVKKLKEKMNRYLGRVADDREPDRKRSDDCFRERMAHGFWQIDRMEFGMESSFIGLQKPLFYCRAYAII